MKSVEEHFKDVREEYPLLSAATAKQVAKHRFLNDFRDSQVQHAADQRLFAEDPDQDIERISDQWRTR